MTFSTGIFLTLVRFYEPLFRFVFIKSVYEFWGEIYTNDKAEENDALSSFINSSLNVELVFIILQSVTTFANQVESKLRGSKNQIHSKV
jgi:hypothetical protein